MLGYVGETFTRPQSVVPLTTVLQASILPRGRSEIDGLHTQNTANIYNEAFESTFSIMSIS